MQTNKFVPLTNKKIPTMVSYSNELNSHVIGDKARLTGLQGKTTVFNFKPLLGKGDKEFSKDKKFWCHLAPTEHQSKKIVTYTAKEASKFFLQELLKNIEVPEQVLIGEPAIRDQAWKVNFRKHVREIFKELEFSTQPIFFPEPFAVFQYYRHEFSQKSPKSEIVLVIDIGGGTFNSCIIKTTDDGYLSRGGGTNIPLGLQAEMCGGMAIDRGLLEIVISKSKKQGVVWKDDPIKRAEKEGSPAFLIIEDAKIKISDKIGEWAKLSDDQSNIQVDLHFEQNELHPDNDIDVSLTGESLKAVIRDLWRRKYGNILLNTVNEAKEKLKKLDFNFEIIDKVIVAGGSSKLPFMKEEIKTVLMTMVKPDDIFIAPYLGRAVAYGLAFEGLEQISKNPSLSTNKIVPCLLNELYLSFKKDRRSPVSMPKIKYGGKYLQNGHLISEPFIIDDYVLEYEFEMPFETNDKVFYYFSDKPLDDTDYLPLNIGQDVFSIKNRNKITKKWKLEIEIQKNGMIKPAFIYKEKGKGAQKGGVRVQLAEFQFQNFNLKEGRSFIGVDFGTTNSYIVKFLNPERGKDREVEYPQFEFDTNILNKVRELETELRELEENGVFNKEDIVKYSQNQMLKLVFHSNKIEGINPAIKYNSYAA